MENQRDVHMTSNVSSNGKPKTNFFSLPSELRNMIYKLALVRQDPIKNPIKLWILDDNSDVSPKLLRTCKTIHAEATQMFYGMNCLALDTFVPEGLPSFFMQIGNNNARSIRHIKLDFPEIETSRKGFTMERGCARTFETIQIHCPNIVTISTVTHDERIFMRNVLDLLRDDDDDCTAILKLVDTHFRTIQSLQEIVVNITEGTLTEHTEKMMESLGWVLNIDRTQGTNFAKRWEPGSVDLEGYRYIDGEDSMERDGYSDSDEPVTLFYEGG